MNSDGIASDLSIETSIQDFEGFNATKKDNSNRPQSRTACLQNVYGCFSRFVLETNGHVVLKVDIS